jgi:hypothetical protein
VVGEQDAVSDGGDLVAHDVGDGLHRIAAELGDVVDRLRARLFENKFQFPLLVGRVDGDECDAREGAAKLQQHPFGDVVRVCGDARAFGMTRG